jgi:D-threo-aldose 1-dehydrogenase
VSAEEHAGRKGKDAFYLSTAPFKPRDDYTREGILRSFHSSLERLRLERVEIVYIHYGDIKEANTRRILDEAYPALADLRRQGLLGCIGMGMDFAEPLVRLAREAEFDIFMLAGRYTLLDTTALDELFPLCEKQGISVALAAPYSSGILASDDLSKGAKYWYKDAPPEVLERARRIKAVCDAHGVAMKAAALQFGLGHPVVAATVPGARNGAEVAENVRMAQVGIPKGLWRDLKAEGLVPTTAPTP